MGHGLYRGVYSSLPDDPDFQKLTPNAKLVFYTARLCAQAGPAAIFRYYLELLVRQTGLSARQVEAALVELEKERWIYREGVVLWIRNGLRFDPNRRPTDHNHRKSVMKALESLPRLAIITRFCEYYDLPSPFEAPSKPLEGPSAPPSIHISPQGVAVGVAVGVGVGKDSLGQSPEGFDRFWAAYPKHKAKGAALKAWKTHHPPLDQVLATLERLKPSREWRKDNGEFIPYPATWLNAQGWLDEPGVRLFDEDDEA